METWKETGNRMRQKKRSLVLVTAPPHRRPHRRRRRRHVYATSRKYYYARALRCASWKCGLMEADENCHVN